MHKVLGSTPRAARETKQEKKIARQPSYVTPSYFLSSLSKGGKLELGDYQI